MIDIVVGAWTFSALEQVLNATDSPHLPRAPPRQNVSLKPSASARSSVNSNRRKSQLGVSQLSSSTFAATPLDDDDGNFERRRSREPTGQQTPELHDIAAHRADFLGMQRRVVEKLSRISNLDILGNASAISPSSSETEGTDEEEEPAPTKSINGLRSHPLGSALGTLQACRQLYLVCFPSISSSALG